MFPSAFAVVRGSTYSVRCTELWAFQLDCFKVQTYYKYPPCTVVDFSQADKIRVWQLWTSVNIYIYIYICKFTKETRAHYITVLHRELNLRIVSSGNVELMNLPYMLSLQMEWCMVLLCFFFYF